MESYHTVTAKLNSKCLSKFRRDIEEQERIIDKLHKARYSPDVFYSQVFLPKVRNGRGNGSERSMEKWEWQWEEHGAGYIYYLIHPLASGVLHAFCCQARKVYCVHVCEHTAK